MSIRCFFQRRNPRTFFRRRNEFHYTSDSFGYTTLSNKSHQRLNPLIVTGLYVQLQLRGMYKCIRIVFVCTLYKNGGRKTERGLCGVVRSFDGSAMHQDSGSQRNLLQVKHALIVSLHLRSHFGYLAQFREDIVGTRLSRVYCMYMSYGST